MNNIYFPPFLIFFKLQTSENFTMYTKPESTGKAVKPHLEVFLALQVTCQ